MTLDEAVRGPSDRVDKKSIEKAVEILTKYKEGKSNLESRIIENEEYYRMKTQGDKEKKQNQPGSSIHSLISTLMQWIITLKQ